LFGPSSLYSLISSSRASGHDHPAALASALTRRLTALAFEHSLNKTLSTPYSAGASESFDMVYHGGKKDDITVLVCVVR
jgi:protein phosphatase PTC7